MPDRTDERTLHRIKLRLEMIPAPLSEAIGEAACLDDVSLINSERLRATLWAVRLELNKATDLYNKCVAEREDKFRRTFGQTR